MRFHDLGSSGLSRSVESGMGASKRYVRILIPRTLSVSLFGKRACEHIIKDVEMKSPWMRVGPRTNNIEKADAQGRSYEDEEESCRLSPRNALQPPEP